MYEFIKEMGEISGFGGSYEDGCRAMLKAGLDWLDAHPEADPHFHGYKGVYGVLSEENEDAKGLTKAAMDAEVLMGGRIVRVGDEATGAMHQAVMSSILFIKAKGWEAYVEEMSKEKSA